MAAEPARSLDRILSSSLETRDERKFGDGLRRTSHDANGDRARAFLELAAN
jgi:hypothetical protein